MADRSVQQPVMERRTDVESRIKARKDYLETVGQRDDSKLLGLLATLFFLPAGIILAVAFATGYLDALQAGSLGGF